MKNTFLYATPLYDRYKGFLKKGTNVNLPDSEDFDFARNFEPFVHFVESHSPIIVLLKNGTNMENISQR